LVLWQLKESQLEGKIFFTDLMDRNGKEQTINISNKFEKVRCEILTLFYLTLDPANESVT
jgi:hypothetical protein